MPSPKRLQPNTTCGGTAGAVRPIRFRGGISDVGHSSSPPLRGTFGTDAAPALIAFEAFDTDHADTAYGPFDTLALRFSMPTDRGHLTTLSGDRRFVDQYL